MIVIFSNIMRETYAVILGYISFNLLQDELLRFHNNKQNMKPVFKALIPIAVQF